jgi:hypothetical protein
MITLGGSGRNHPSVISSVTCAGWGRLCVAELAHLRTPLLTTWPVVTEALWLLRHNANVVSGLFRGFADGVWALVPIPTDALPWLETFLKRYHKLGAQLADASLV